MFLWETEMYANLKKKKKKYYEFYCYSKLSYTVQLTGGCWRTHETKTNDINDKDK